MERDYAVKLTEVDSRSKSNTHRIDKIEKKQDDLNEIVTSVGLLAKEQKYVKRDVAEIKDNVKVLTDKPAKRWDSLMEKVIALVVAGVGGFLLAQIGL